MVSIQTRGLHVLPLPYPREVEHENGRNFRELVLFPAFDIFLPTFFARHFHRRRKTVLEDGLNCFDTSRFFGLLLLTDFRSFVFTFASPKYPYDTLDYVVHVIRILSWLCGRRGGWTGWRNIFLQEKCPRRLGWGGCQWSLVLLSEQISMVVEVGHFCKGFNFTSDCWEVANGSDWVESGVDEELSPRSEWSFSMKSSF